MKRILIYASFFMVLIGISANITRDDETVMVTGADGLRLQVEAHILEFETEPHEPRYDVVWHFVPGLHGIEFDLEMSYQNMLLNGKFDSALMIGRSVPYIGCSHTFRNNRIYRGNENSPYVGLLINVAWGGEELVQMLDILDEHNVQASLFFEGKYANKNPDLVLDAFNRGHIIGNHSYSHPANWLSLSYDGFEEEITRTNEILADIIGEEILFFAPPGGAFTHDTIQAAYDQGMYTILWSADSIDWRGESANVLVDRVMRRITPGGLILTHPKPETVIALPEIIEQIRRQGLEFRRIDTIVSGERKGHFGN